MSERPLLKPRHDLAPALDRPKVTVCMTTFNQASYLPIALDSILAQRTTFPFEVVVADDASTDGTRETLTAYASRYPQVIRPILREKNWGTKTNWPDMMRQGRGEYLALLDGDDYWIEEQKLQKQADFLDANRDYTYCGHDAEIIEPDGRRHLFCNPRVPDVISLDYIISFFGCPEAPGSHFFRRAAFERFPESYFEMTRTTNNGDWGLITMMAKQGKVRHFAGFVGSAYRIHDNGVWTAMSWTQRQETNIKVLRWMLNELGDAHCKVVRTELAGRRWVLAESYAELNETAAALRTLADGYAEIQRANHRMALTTGYARALARSVRTRVGAELRRRGLRRPGRAERATPAS